MATLDFNASITSDNKQPALMMERLRRIPTRTLSRVVVGAVLFLVAVGCGGEDEPDRPETIRTMAEDLVAGPLADGAGLGELRPTCDEVVDAVVGTTFECTAVTEGQRTVWIDAVINAEGRIDLTTRNVITASAIPSFESAAVVGLNRSVGTSLGDDDVDCGDESVVIGSDQTLVCAVTDPVNREVFDLTMTMTDIEARKFTMSVSAEPRG